MQSPCQQDSEIDLPTVQVWSFVNPRRSPAGNIETIARRLDRCYLQTQKTWAELRRDITHPEHQADLVRLLRRCDRLQSALRAMLEKISPNQ